MSNQSANEYAQQASKQATIGLTFSIIGIFFGILFAIFGIVGGSAADKKLRHLTASNKEDQLYLDKVHWRAQMAIWIGVFDLIISGLVILFIIIGAMLGASDPTTQTIYTY